MKKYLLLFALAALTSFSYAAEKLSRPLLQIAEQYIGFQMMQQKRKPVNGLIIGRHMIAKNRIFA